MAVGKTQQDAALRQIVASAREHPQPSNGRPVCIAVTQDGQGDVVVLQSQVPSKQEGMCEVNGQEVKRTGYVSMKELSDYQRLVGHPRKTRPAEGEMVTVVVELKTYKHVWTRSYWEGGSLDGLQSLSPTTTPEKPAEPTPEKPSADPKKDAKKLIETTVDDLNRTIRGAIKEGFPELK